MYHNTLMDLSTHRAIDDDVINLFHVASFLQACLPAYRVTGSTIKLSRCTAFCRSLQEGFYVYDYTRIHFFVRNNSAKFVHISSSSSSISSVSLCTSGAYIFLASFHIWSTALVVSCSGGSAVPYLSRSVILPACL